MVGIPGRSKGCKTCRRRKTGCDLQEPQCGQCKKSGRHCEGFDKDIAFIHRTPQGLLRKGQEQCQGPAPWETSCGANSTSTKQIPPQINNAAIYVDGMLHTFLVAFLPSSPILPLSHHSNITVPPAPWMRIAIAHPRRGPLLSTALQALCITKIARAHGDQALLMQGMAAHTQALRALQNATNDRNTALTDETMAAIRVLGTYELHEGTMGSVVGWTSHEEGVDQLVQLRGFNSSQYESELGQALFGEVRRSAMIRGLQFFKGSFFSETRWCTEPWGTKPKDYVQLLYDIGLLLPPILEELHTIQSLPNDPRRAQIWQSDIRPGPFEASFDFLNIHVADGLDFFWALRILLHTVLRRLSDAPEQSDAIIGVCACNIARSVPYFTQPKCGFLGVQWLIFPLKTAFSAFRQMGWKTEWEWSRGVMVAMKNRGVSYGGDLVEAQWGERVR
ncbi:Protein of unknown function DUF3468 [Aspergillus oryzae]|uniref:Zn(2)-C6 fungal-type domain-containing protein n=1 Tax=Aspergillus oryzae TaxID=5062 RepID=A0A1S9DST7_ASPOZ|nr:Protein of unknown function DUF3468 [Aspergillus oryzae]